MRNGTPVFTGRQVGAARRLSNEERELIIAALEETSEKLVSFESLAHEDVGEEIEEEDWG